eukprot:TCONS_00008282-protein
MMRIMQTQMIYGAFSKEDLVYPEIQIKKLFAAPFERALTERSKSKEHLRLQSKIFVLKYSLTPFITSYEEEWEDRLTDKKVRAWRLISCYGETNLDTLHDRILGPAMGWCRHFHTYKYIVPTNGACFGPGTSEAIDKMHAMTSYTLDSSKYQLAHLLREPGQRLVYIYDLGDTWTHNLELVQVANRGDLLEMPCDDQVQNALIKEYNGELPKIKGVQLFAGELNCAPENSDGCGGMGNYGHLLKKGKKHISPEATRSPNWKDHKIKNAFKFDLDAHRKRLAEAIAGKSSAKTGQKICNMMLQPDSHRFLNQQTRPGERVHEKCVGSLKTGCVPMSETIKIRPDKENEAVCAACGRQPNVQAGFKPLLRCGSCKAAWYCGKSCQHSDWKNHKDKCVKMRKERKEYKKEVSSCDDQKVLAARCSR